MFDTLAGVILAVGAVGFLVNVFVGRAGFDFGYVESTFPMFLQATRTTLYTTTVSFAMGLVIGFLLGWARAARTVPIRKILSDRRKATLATRPTMGNRAEDVGIILLTATRYYMRRMADAYVEIIRGTPLFVQIVFAWSVLLVNFPRLPELSLIAGIAALTANTGGYQAEIFRAGFQTVHTGQVEGARAIGLSRWGAMRHIVLPQALRLVIPPLTNEYIGLLKASSLLFIIGVEELTTVGRMEAFTQFKIFEVFAIVTGVYLLITVPFSKIVEYFERRYRIPGLGIARARPRV
ncbi:MAG TPA: amino acid ABC transporter permease [Thermoplasmata archaeon]|nr:amino acid ABC transporter permease [Thermoplasmata archaeon]